MPLILLHKVSSPLGRVICEADIGLHTFLGEYHVCVTTPDRRTPEGEPPPRRALWKTGQKQDPLCSRTALHILAGAHVVGHRWETVLLVVQ